jgi:hypothetical protein
MEAFTAEELAEIVRELGLPAEIEIDDDHSTRIVVNTDDVEWSVILGDNGPFYRSVALATHKFVEEEPFAYANSWNFAHIPPALVLDDPATKAPMIDEDGNYLVGLLWRIYFWNSISVEYLSNSFASFHEDVLEFQEIEEFIDDDDEDGEESEEAERGEHDPIDRLLQIQLELRLRSPQSSRELARSLKTTKYEINNILYHEPEIFEKEGTSPPMWSNKGEIQ